jgi:hypothetical protein
MSKKRVLPFSGNPEGEGSRHIIIINAITHKKTII